MPYKVSFPRTEQPEVRRGIGLHSLLEIFFMNVPQYLAHWKPRSSTRLLFLVTQKPRLTATPIQEQAKGLNRYVEVSRSPTVSPQCVTAGINAMLWLRDDSKARLSTRRSFLHIITSSKSKSNPCTRHYEADEHQTDSCRALIHRDTSCREELSGHPWRSSPSSVPQCPPKPLPRLSDGSG